MVSTIWSIVWGPSFVAASASFLFLAVALNADAAAQFAPQAGPSIAMEPSALPSPDNALVLPPLSGPEFPAAPPRIETPVIPSAFIGCWQGEPGGFDSVATTAGVVDIGTPGKTTFCFDGHSVEVPEAQVRVSAKAHALDILVHLGLGYSTYDAHGVQTDIFSIDPGRIYARTTLVIIDTTHWLYVIPMRTPQPAAAEEIVTLVGTDTLLVRARMIVAFGGLKMWGTWHAYFHRVSA